MGSSRLTLVSVAIALALLTSGCGNDGWQPVSNRSWWPSELQPQGGVGGALADAVGDITFTDGCLAAVLEEGGTLQTFAVVPARGSRVVEKDGVLGLQLGRTVIPEGTGFVHAAASYRSPSDDAERGYARHCGADEIMYVMPD